MTVPVESDGTSTQSTKAPVDETYDSVSKFIGEHEVEVANTRSQGSWAPLGEVQRFWMLPPLELDFQEVTVEDTSIGKLMFVPEATDGVEVTVMLM